MEEEILACIDDENLKYLESGQISKYIFPVERKEAHKDKVSHLIIRLFIMAITPENEVLYLVQKRSKNKKSHPDYFTDSASGHVEYTEKIDLGDIRDNALRELKEEFGISADKVQKILFHDLKVEKDNFTNEIAYVFYGLVDADVKLVPDSHELNTEGSRFYTRTDLNGLLSSEQCIDYSKAHWLRLLDTDIIKLFEKKEKIKGRRDFALFLGRFQPFHLGHLFVIEEILKNFKRIKIGIGSSQLSHARNDPFTSEERQQFIKSTLDSVGLNTKYEIFEIPDIFNAEKWVDHVISIVGYFDELVSNSDWVRQLFQNKGYNIAEKLPFKMEDLNATRIRQLISKDSEKWGSLVPEEVELLIKDFKGIERIKSLYNDTE
jgi:nicotinamide-nucleotide adenylyltransferase